MNKKVIFSNTSMKRIKTTIENLSSSFQVIFFDEEKHYIIIRQLKKKSTQVLKFHPSRTYLVTEDNLSLKMKRIHIFTNRENKHFLAFKYTNPIDFQIWVKEYTDAKIISLNFEDFYTQVTYSSNNRIYPLILPNADSYYSLYCLETGIISAISPYAFNNNLY